MNYLLLLPYCYTRKAFDVYNILLKEHGQSSLLTATDSPNFVVDKILYGRKSFRLRISDNDLFFFDLISISKCFSNYKIVVLPIEEHFMSLFYDFVDKYGAMNFLFLFPERFAFELARDKRELNRCCYYSNIPCPRFFESSDVFSISTLDCPLIVKPRHGSGSKGFIFIDSEHDLKKLQFINLDDYVIQERLPNGRDVKGAFFLCDHGKVIASYSHQRVRTYPVDGGVTVYSRFDMDEKAVQAGAKVLQELKWTGLAMVELLWDKRDENYKVIEINPRLWGSILLDQFSGAFLLKNYVELSLGRDPVRQELRQDSEIRWLFPFELMNLILAKGQIPGFWHFGRQTCLINITYSSFMRSFMFHLLYYLQAGNYKKFLSKWLS